MSQMTFAEVCEMEQIPGDPDYTGWLAEGRPELEPAGPASVEPVPSEACSL